MVAGASYSQPVDLRPVVLDPSAGAIPGLYAAIRQPAGAVHQRGYSL
jgi:hypothetical protein